MTPTEQRLPGLPFQEAIDYSIRRQVVLPAEYYGTLQGAARARAFSVAGLSGLDQLQGVLDSLTRAMKKGHSYAKWKSKVRGGSVKLDLPDHRTENIFRTNIQGSYNRGRWEQQVRHKATRPFLMYDATNDSRTRPAHAAMDGVIRPVEDPFWDVRYPPNGFQCRCHVISLTEKQAARRGGVTDVVPPDGQPDPGWEYHPGKDPDAGIGRAQARVTRTANPALAHAMEQRKAPDPWPMLTTGDLHDLDRIKSLGADRFAELEAFTLPNSRDKVPEMTLRGKTIRELLQANIDEELLADAMPLTRKHLFERLAEAQPLGLEAATKGTGKGRGAKAVKRAAKKYPASWVARGNLAPVRVTYSAQRGQYRARKWNRKDRVFEPTIRTDASSTAEHEYAHHLQAQMPSLDAVFQAEHLARTAGDPLEVINYLGERGRPDKYAEKYQGREYGHTRPLEVMTMALQPLIGEDRQADLYLARMLQKDPDMVRLALGLLFHYDPGLP